ncbi:hypothetical protein KPL74_06475 [Bacillus sp. NP157]|nr:hypothetical protein KPL74_06475 [Bacillus sp. NP157]
MTFLATLTPSVLGERFPSDTHHGYITEVHTMSLELDIVGFRVGMSTWYVAAFSNEDFAGDLEFARSMARRHARFHPGEDLMADSRTVKFYRADASPDAPFRQTPLPDGVRIWGFQRLLTNVIVSYLTARPSVMQLYFLAVNQVLERWYCRLSDRFCRPGGVEGCGLLARQIAVPHEDEGGFYGYQRCDEGIQVAAARGGCAEAGQLRPDVESGRSFHGSAGAS